MLEFRSKKVDSTYLMLNLGVVLFLMGIAVVAYVKEKDIFVLIVMGTISIVMIASLIFANRILKIVINDAHLEVHYILKVYSVAIKNITKISKGETMWSGFYKYGTTIKGLTVFAKFKNDLYITPENEQILIEKLQEINSDIQFAIKN